MLKHINFRTEEYILKDLAYNDIVYAWLLLHSHYNKAEQYNYIYKNSFTQEDIAKDIHKCRQTVSKRLKELVSADIIRECKYNGKQVYKLPYYNDEYAELDGETVFQLIALPFKDTREELIKTYAYLWKRQISLNEENKTRDKPAHSFSCSYKEVLEVFDHSTGNAQAYDRMRGIFTILQGAGIIRFRTTLAHQDEYGHWIPAEMEVYKVNQKASDEWLGSRPLQFNKILPA